MPVSTACSSTATSSIMRLLILATLITVASSSCHCQCDIDEFEKELQYGFCEGANQPLTIDEFVFDPYPLEVYNGAIIKLSLGITLHEPIPVGAQVSVRIVKDLLIDLPLPCLEFGDVHFGSW
jgi:hypothetical protein